MDPTNENLLKQMTEQVERLNILSRKLFTIRIEHAEAHGDFDEARGNLQRNLKVGQAAIDNCISRLRVEEIKYAMCHDPDSVTKDDLSFVVNTLTDGLLNKIMGEDKHKGHDHEIQVIGVGDIANGKVNLKDIMDNASH